MDSMDCCKTEIPLQFKTCKCYIWRIQSWCFGTRPTSSRGHSADRQEPMIAQKTHYENNCKIIPANTNIKTNLFVFGEYEYERIRRAVIVTNNSFGAKNSEYSANTNTNEYRPVEFIRIRRIRIYCHPWGVECRLPLRHNPLRVILSAYLRICKLNL
jgi:hypothetical protein